ncbi:TetR/AcrR family transcriptional regulator [Clostridium sp. M14]|uniref:TetR/AcrR family transcriptional regulator n=1 Tax=Clostridium sp. M14 TaxID=2716311 RepID=UPI001CCB2C24|nr:TetR/AcrR family transcriptional regulator [Clostridium sp. M14]MBZ9693497.1 TetR/AcrR family transcriptional regulator [Clostridium sp. M14]
MKQKPNRIAEQSKKWLIEALFDLMEEKPYSTITVKEISDKAQLSRRTFYRNFKVKEDLLCSKTI